MIVLIVDNYNAHKTHEVKTLAHQLNINLLFCRLTPNLRAEFDRATLVGSQCIDQALALRAQGHQPAAG